MIGEVETEEVTHTNQNDKIGREQPQEKKFVEEETEAKDRPTTTEPIVPIPNPQRLKKNKLDNNLQSLWMCSRNCILTFHLLMR